MNIIDITVADDEQIRTFLEAPVFILSPSRRVGPGKFEGNPHQSLAEVLYDKSLEGWNDNETGDVSTWGLHVSLLGRFLLVEDDRGFVTVEEFKTVGEAQAAFDAYEQGYADWCDDDACEEGDV